LAHLLLDEGMMFRESRWLFARIYYHSGTAQGDHYTPFIKFGNQWAGFNVVEVADMYEGHFEAAALGGGYRGC
jgi:hypothetical protein